MLNLVPSHSSLTHTYTMMAHLFLSLATQGPYFGGAHECGAWMFDAGAPPPFNPADLVCGPCSARISGSSCDKHGVDGLEFKCRYCCSGAVFFCFGTTHFCNTCHNNYAECQTRESEGTLPHCPAGPHLVQLEGGEDACPLGIAPHPPTGTEFVLGCSTCMEERADGGKKLVVKRR